MAFARFSAVIPKRLTTKNRKAAMAPASARLCFPMNLLARCDCRILVCVTSGIAMADESGKITRFLQEIKAGDRAAESRLIEAVYPKLRRIAAHYLRQERVGHTLQATALVNEAHLQLLGDA